MGGGFRKRSIKGTDIVPQESVLTFDSTVGKLSAMFIVHFRVTREEVEGSQHLKIIFEKGEVLITLIATHYMCV